MIKIMYQKTLTIENPVIILNEQMAFTYTQILNLLIKCDTLDKLTSTMKSIIWITNAEYYFDWGFGSNHFWLKQRRDYRSEELFENRILIVEFEENTA